jgi:hypothetical protein
MEVYRPFVFLITTLLLVGDAFCLGPRKARVLPVINLEVVLTEDRPKFIKIFSDLAPGYGFRVLKSKAKSKNEPHLIRVVGGVFSQPFQPGIKTDFGMMGLVKGFQPAFIEGNFSVSGFRVGAKKLEEHLILTSMGELEMGSEMALMRELATELLKNLRSLSTKDGMF